VILPNPEGLIIPKLTDGRFFPFVKNERSAPHHDCPSASISRWRSAKKLTRSRRRT